MKRYYNPDEVGTNEDNSSRIVVPSPTIQESSNTNEEPNNNQSFSGEEFDSSQLPSDPGLRIPISSYNPNIRDQVRRAYLQKGPCQPFEHKFPMKVVSANKSRRFIPAWFTEHDWLEYSISKDAAYCLYCYLFKPNKGKQSGGDVFVTVGFNSWKDKSRLNVHVGKHDSEHNEARRSCDALMNQNAHIETVLDKQSMQTKNDYRIRLIASLDCVRYLLRLGLPFRGHDESEDSLNPGNFLVTMEFLRDHNLEIASVVMDNAPGNCKLLAPSIQKDLTHACAIETLNVIIQDVGDSLYSVLVDESRDVSTKEQMSVVIRYVDDTGHVKERFIGVEHVTSTTSLALKEAIDTLFSRYNLSISRLRGQGYDGASNMQGRLSGLKTLILNENSTAYYIHCFAHQLQLALVAVATKNLLIAEFFRVVAQLINVIGGSCKRSDILREKQLNFIVEALESGKISSGRGLNQESSLQRAGDTRWGSHYRSLVSLISMFSAVGDVLDVIHDDEVTTSMQKVEIEYLLKMMHCFDFVLNLHMMKFILGISNELSQALQRRDQDIINAMDLVRVCRHRLQACRDDGWDSLFEEVCIFCDQHSISIPNMNDTFIRFDSRGRPVRKGPTLTNLHHYRYDLFCAVIDLQLQELSDRFSEASTELLLCIACLSPQDSFSAFEKNKLLRLTEFYPQDFSPSDVCILKDQLESYIFDVRSNALFNDLKGLGDLAEKLVETKKHKVFPLVYKLLTLALILPVATASVERVFSAMNIVKDRLSNRMSDDWLNDRLTVYVEKDIFLKIDNDVIIERYQSMKTRREQL
ncbi:unnamed protein product [Cuscuta epithymum]|uniref:TTF-type domain-containing protein n=1 Tax=Cuscuta epithymum TaxID=186058 RepID=A0AAV0FXI0_9ASTE|nr:unnamed protein product [Cuscuta epithymum]